jgi:hypothetical protein
LILSLQHTQKFLNLKSNILNKKQTLRKFALSGLTFKDIPNGFNYQMELRYIEAISFEEAQEEFRIYMNDKFPNHTLQNMAIMEI